MNLEEVARLAGVSRSTVSRVLNRDPRVSDAARERVQTVVREHHYHPNAAARSLASRRTRILGLLIPQAVGSVFSDSFFPTLIQGVAEGCTTADHDLSLLLDTSGDHRAVDRLYQRVIRGRHVDGVVIASNLVDDPIVARLQDDRFPSVLIGRDPQGRSSFVDADNRQAARDAVAHLIGHGRRRIATIAGPANMIAAIDRFGGYVTALQEAGRLPDPALTTHADFTRPGGYRAMMAMLPHRPDAVFAASDAMATGALQALGEAGLQVPDDVALIGFDGLDGDMLAQGALSTMVQPVADLGRQAVQTLLRLVEMPDQAPIQLLFPTTMVLRGSCGCADVRPLDDRRADKASTERERTTEAIAS